ncbi:MAG: hypothetical protein P8X57_09525, partial [Cyclobacteriaceae bacterium]
MIADIRNRFNQNFTPEKYKALQDYITQKYDHKPPFRIAETPIFVPDILKNRLIEACDDINSVICQPNFKEITTEALRHPMLRVPGEDYHTRFLQMDFGICLDDNGDPFPQLIEVQGFPSLYFFQDILASAYKKFYDIPADMTVHVNDMNREEYIGLLKDIIVGDTDPKNV